MARTRPPSPCRSAGAGAAPVRSAAPHRAAPRRAGAAQGDEAVGGTPLGGARPRQQYVFGVPPGNTAVLCSDGLVENRKRGVDAGLDELVSVAAQAPAEAVENPAVLLDCLVKRMLAGYEQDDDVTVLVVHSPRRDAGAPPRRVGGTQTARKGKA